MPLSLVAEERESCRLADPPPSTPVLRSKSSIDHPSFSHDLMMASYLPSDKEIILLCRNSRNLFGRGSVKISESVFVKFGLGILPAEAATQKYVWEQVDHNVFRVPQPYRYFQDKSLGPELTIGYLVMEYINGISLSRYLEHTTADEQEAIIDAVVGVT
jgi:hypothetical protein